MEITDAVIYCLAKDVGENGGKGRLHLKFKIPVLFTEMLI